MFNKKHIVALATSFSLALGVTLASGPAMASSLSPEDHQREFISLVNAERAKLGNVAPLQAAPVLFDMAKTHVNSWESAGGPYHNSNATIEGMMRGAQCTGEYAELYTPSVGTPANLLQAYKNSTSHWNALMDSPNKAKRFIGSYTNASGDNTVYMSGVCANNEYVSTPLKVTTTESTDKTQDFAISGFTNFSTAIRNQVATTPIGTTVVNSGHSKTGRNQGLWTLPRYNGTYTFTTAGIPGNQTAASGSFDYSGVETTLKTDGSTVTAPGTTAGFDLEVYPFHDRELIVEYSTDNGASWSANGGTVTSSFVPLDPEDEGYVAPDGGYTGSFKVSLNRTDSDGRTVLVRVVAPAVDYAPAKVSGVTTINFLEVPYDFGTIDETVSFEDPDITILSNEGARFDGVVAGGKGIRWVLENEDGHKIAADHVNADASIRVDIPARLIPYEEGTYLYTLSFCSTGNTVDLNDECGGKVFVKDLNVTVIKPVVTSTLPSSFVAELGEDWTASADFGLFSLSANRSPVGTWSAYTLDNSTSEFESIGGGTVDSDGKMQGVAAAFGNIPTSKAGVTTVRVTYSPTDPNFNDLTQHLSVSVNKASTVVELPSQWKDTVLDTSESLSGVAKVNTAYTGDVSWEIQKSTSGVSGWTKVSGGTVNNSDINWSVKQGTDSSFWRLHILGTDSSVQYSSPVIHTALPQIDATFTVDDKFADTNELDIGQSFSGSFPVSVSGSTQNKVTVALQSSSDGSRWVNIDENVVKNGETVNWTITGKNSPTERQYRFFIAGMDRVNEFTSPVITVKPPLRFTPVVVSHDSNWKNKSILESETVVGTFVLNSTTHYSVKYNIQSRPVGANAWSTVRTGFASAGSTVTWDAPFSAVPTEFRVVVPETVGHAGSTSSVITVKPLISGVTIAVNDFDWKNVTVNKNATLNGTVTTKSAATGNFTLVFEAKTNAGWDALWAKEVSNNKVSAWAINTNTLIEEGSSGQFRFRTLGNAYTAESVSPTITVTVAYTVHDAAINNGAKWVTQSLKAGQTVSGEGVVNSSAKGEFVVNIQKSVDGGTKWATIKTVGTVDHKFNWSFVTEGEKKTLYRTTVGATATNKTATSSVITITAPVVIPPVVAQDVKLTASNWKNASTAKGASVSGTVSAASNYKGDITVALQSSVDNKTWVTIETLKAQNGKPVNWKFTNTKGGTTYLRLQVAKTPNVNAASTSVITVNTTAPAVAKKSTITGWVTTAVTTDKATTRTITVSNAGRVEVLNGGKWATFKNLNAGSNKVSLPAPKAGVKATYRVVVPAVSGKWTGTTSGNWVVTGKAAAKKSTISGWAGGSTTVTKSTSRTITVSNAGRVEVLKGNKWTTFKSLKAGKTKVSFPAPKAGVKATYRVVVPAVSGKWTGTTSGNWVVTGKVVAKKSTISGWAKGSTTVTKATARTIAVSNAGRVEVLKGKKWVTFKSLKAGKTKVSFPAPKAGVKATYRVVVPAVSGKWTGTTSGNWSVVGKKAAAKKAVVGKRSSVTLKTPSKAPSPLKEPSALVEVPTGPSSVQTKPQQQAPAPAPAPALAEAGDNPVSGSVTVKRYASQLAPGGDSQWKVIGTSTVDGITLEYSANNDGTGYRLAIFSDNPKVADAVISFVN